MTSFERAPARPGPSTGAAYPTPATTLTGHRLFLSLMLLTQFLVVLLDTVAALGLPAIQRDLGFSGPDVQWVLTAYLIAYGGLLVLAGRTADVFGRRRVLVGGLLLFTAASCLCGAAGSAATLIAARAVQGAGAAFASAAALSMVTVMFTGRARHAALGAWGLVSGFSASVGVVLGGIVTELLGWRWTFLLLAPLGLAIALLTRRFAPGLGALPRTRPLDVGGAVTCTVGVTLVVLGISRSHDAALTSPGTLAPFAAGVAMIAFFLAWERRAAAPLMPLWVLRRRSVVGSNLGAAVFGAVLFGVFILASLYLQDGLGYEPIATGLALVPMGVMSLTLGVAVGRLVTRFGYRAIVVIGLAVMAAGAGALSVGAGDGLLAAFLPASLLFGVGLCLSEISTIIGATDELGHGELAGLASGLWSTAFQLGGAIGTAILTTVMAAASDDAGAQGVIDGFAMAAATGAGIALAGALLVLGILPARR